MADIRIKDLATTATTTASDDFMAVDGATNGTRKMNAAAPAFLTSVTTPSLTSPASTPLTLGLGTGGTALTLASSTLAATFAGTLTTAGDITAGDNTHLGRLNVNDSTGGLGEVLIFANVLKFSARTAGGSLGFRVNGDNSTVLDIASTGVVSISNATAGSAGAGALVVTGGLSAGNNTNASYFGGAINATGTGITLNDGSGRILALLPPQTATSNIARIGTTSNHPLVLQAGGVTGLTITEITGAATFAGAVTATSASAHIFGTTNTVTMTAGVLSIYNTTAISAAAPSTHKVSILIGGVQFYLLASNV